MNYYDRYKELRELYSISWDPEDTNADIIVQNIGTGYAHKKYRVLKNRPGLDSKDLAIICDRGNLCFGYRDEAGIICIYTD